VARSDIGEHALQCSCLDPLFGCGDETGYLQLLIPLWFATSPHRRPPAQCFTRSNSTRLQVLLRSRLGLHCVPVAKAGLRAAVRLSSLTIAGSKLTRVQDVELASALGSPQVYIGA